jgi:hypothetical protein
MFRVIDKSAVHSSIFLHVCYVKKGLHQTRALCCQGADVVVAGKPAGEFLSTETILCFWQLFVVVHFRHKKAMRMLRERLPASAVHTCRLVVVGLPGAALCSAFQPSPQVLLYTIGKFAMADIT